MQREKKIIMKILFLIIAVPSNYSVDYIRSNFNWYRECVVIRSLSENSLGLSDNLSIRE